MSFQCSNADFHVRSVHDNELFAVRRQALCSSEVFRDMFTCCGESEETVDLHETADSLAALLILLHHPPQPPTKIKRDKYNFIPKVWNDPRTVIPLPLLPRLFELADKYALPSDSVTEVSPCLHRSFGIPLRLARVKILPRFIRSITSFVTT
ncbi:hypothetical protein C8R41DRAFT_309138 [Lentinula lateritia]|uniref:BTB domain-containing protein n=1 Tax=Lentinula lateritia TaxID=40482 RepID=A0ABQ8VH34_9AGAR|nr:hypothetical protein C8R41DRAFT_309138 [Lentinula lateritia]